MRAEQAADPCIVADIWGVGLVHDELEAVEQPRVLVEEGAEEALAVGDQRGERLARAVGKPLEVLDRAARGRRVGGRRRLRARAVARRSVEEAEDERPARGEALEDLALLAAVVGGEVRGERRSHARIGLDGDVARRPIVLERAADGAVARAELEHAVVRLHVLQRQDLLVPLVRVCVDRCAALVDEDEPVEPRALTVEQAGVCLLLEPTPRLRRPHGAEGGL